MAEFLKLKKSNCKNCYKCIRHCPVKSIKFSGNQAQKEHFQRAFFKLLHIIAFQSSATPFAFILCITKY